MRRMSGDDATAFVYLDLTFVYRNRPIWIRVMPQSLAFALIRMIICMVPK